MIYIVGLGPGSKDYILPAAINIIKKSHIVVGFKRAIDSLDFIEINKKYIKTLKDIDDIILSYSEDYSKIISIVASGDPTFYGITNYVKSKTEEFEVIPGISSFQYLTAKIKMPWNNAYLGSLHGRNEEFINNVKTNLLSIWLTDRENNPRVLCSILKENNINCKVIIGENLSYEDESIMVGIPSDFLKKEFSDLNVFIINRE